MASMWLPIALIVVSNTVYQICAKSVPDGIDPLASLVVTYLVAAIASLVLYLVANKGGNIAAEVAKINWASILLGVVIVGLEGGFILAFRAGWQVSTAQLVASSILAAVLVVVGFLAYKEPITLTKVLGVAIILVGIFVLNR